MTTYTAKQSKLYWLESSLRKSLLIRVGSSELFWRIFFCCYHRDCVAVLLRLSASLVFLGTCVFFFFFNPDPALPCCNGRTYFEQAFSYVHNIPPTSVHAFAKPTSYLRFTNSFYKQLYGTKLWSNKTLLLYTILATVFHVTKCGTPLATYFAGLPPIRSSALL